MAWYSSSLMVALFILSQNDYVLCSVSKRQVHTYPWPDCSNYNSCQQARKEGFFPNIVYVNAATKDNDILHYAFSTMEIPTLVMAHSSGGYATMKFNWDKLLHTNSSEKGSGITFEGQKGFKVDYQMAVAFTKLIEYYDFDDDANLVEYVKKNSSHMLWNVRDFNNSWWEELALDSERPNTFTFSTNNYTVFNETNAGNITFAFRVPNSDGRDYLLPSLKYTANETLFDFILANYTPSYNKSRFAIEVVAVSQSTNKDMSIEESKSIDDEYSPGVFRVENWYMDPSRKSDSGFVQWKPVCYLDKGRGRAVASKVVSYDFDSLDKRPDERHLLNNSIVFGLFGNSLWNKDTVIIQATNISFGLAKDGFYTGTNYTVWTASIGYGSPPEDTISQTVIIIIACGLGLPVLIILFGGVYLIVTKIRKRSQQYRPLNSVSSGSPQVN